MEEIDKEASEVFLEGSRQEIKRHQEVVLDEVLGDYKDVVKAAKASLKKSSSREVQSISRWLEFAPLAYILGVYW